MNTSIDIDIVLTKLPVESRRGYLLNSSAAVISTTNVTYKYGQIITD